MSNDKKHGNQESLRGNQNAKIPDSQVMSQREYFRLTVKEQAKYRRKAVTSGHKNLHHQIRFYLENQDKIEKLLN